MLTASSVQAEWCCSGGGNMFQTTAEYDKNALPTYPQKLFDWIASSLSTSLEHSVCSESR